MNFSIIITGKELFTGVRDENGYWLTNYFSGCGYKCQEIRIINDKIELIRKTIIDISRCNDFVIITGGMGGSDLDVTRQVALELSNTPPKILGKMYRDQIKKCYSKWNCRWPRGISKQLVVPKEAEIFLNDLGTSPAFSIFINSTMLIFLPGVPKEVKNLIETSISQYISIKYKPYLTVKEIHKIEKKIEGKAELEVNKSLKEQGWFNDKNVDVLLRVINNQIKITLTIYKHHEYYKKKWEDFIYSLEGG
ncbi:molybdopterin-binding protein [Bacillus mycoides]|nr:molybdopterin-binding protein [Bacillus mycoides]